MTVTFQIMAKFIHWGETEKDKQVRLILVLLVLRASGFVTSHLLEVKLNGAAALLVHLIEDP